MKATSAKERAAIKVSVEERLTQLEESVVQGDEAADREELLRRIRNIRLQLWK